MATVRDELEQLQALPDASTAEALLREALASLLPVALRANADALALQSAAIDGARLRPRIAEYRLTAIADALQLDDLEFLALTLAATLELDPALAAAVSMLQGSPPQRGPERATLGLIAAVASRLAGFSEGDAMKSLLNGRALGTGLLRLGRVDGATHARTLELPAQIVTLMLGDELPRREDFGEFSAQLLPEPGFPLPQAWDEIAEAWVQRIGGRPGVLVLRGSDIASMRLFAARIAGSLRMQLAEIEPHQSTSDFSHCFRRSPALPAWLGATNALPLIALEAAPGERAKLPGGYSGPLIVLASAGTALGGSLTGIEELELPAPRAVDRCAIWQALAGRAPDVQERVLIGATHCGIGVLAQAATLAHTQACTPAVALARTLRVQARELAQWAQVSTDTVAEDALIGSLELHRELDLLRARCFERAELFASLGEVLRGRGGVGVKALFVGASGTGKTLAAQWLADRLGRPLVRVDLAGVVSKYIGETEKSLAQLMERAERLDAVLLFDEADSLFGARTEVRQANDRYANMQTNYLLQRLETFSGIAVLTSNSKTRFDGAFLRRLDAIVEFALPNAHERRELWRTHLGARHAVDEHALSSLAALVDLAGGHVRNAVVDAAVLARRRGAGELIVYGDLVAAITAELAKLGRRAPDGLSSGGM